MPIKILVVEDDASIRESLLDLLEAEDYEARGAENGTSGIQTALDFLPDLIICDIMMPDLDGYSVLEQLQQQPATATIPFVFLTAKADRADQRRGMSLGADDYLTKPFTRQDILQAVEARLARRKELNKQHDVQLTALRDSIALALPHELRTPLSGLKTGASVIVETADHMTLEEIKNVAHIMYQSAERLEHLIVNYLMYAELEVSLTDPVRLEALRTRKTYSVRLVAAQTARTVAERVKRAADLKLDLADAAVRIADLHLAKLVEELLDNAFKFSSPGTVVELKGETVGEAYQLRVIDHGRGLTPEQIIQVGAYMQFDRKLHEQQGTGLGLVIAKRLADLYHGKVELRSVPDVETTVTVTLTPA
jgi:two-component system sensor histidine kinase/response regulator